MIVYYVLNPMNRAKRQYIRLAGKYNLLTAQSKCKELIRSGKYNLGKFLITTKSKVEIKKQNLKVDFSDKINMFYINTEK